jgi:ribonuclease T1
MSAFSKAAALFAAVLTALIAAWAPTATAEKPHQAPSLVQTARGGEILATIQIASLPAEAQETLRLIKAGGPFPYPKDGVTFGNREKRLPLEPKGYYREYTVKTHGSRDRGARRIVAGSGGDFYYTDDHYNTFKLIVE